MNHRVMETTRRELSDPKSQCVGGVVNVAGFANSFSRVGLREHAIEGPCGDSAGVQNARHDANRGFPFRARRVGRAPG